MAEMDISPEDREKLAKSKFKEWADEWFKEVGPEAFKSFLEEARQAAGGSSGGQGNQPNQGQTPQPQGQQPQPRRRSLLDIALTDTFGF